MATFSNSNTDGAQIMAQTVTELEQQAEEASAKDFEDGFSQNSVSQSITTITANAVIISALAMSYDGTPDQTPTGTGHVEDQDNWENVQQHIAAIGHVLSTTIGSYTLGWEQTDGCGWSLILAAFESTAPPPVPDDIVLVGVGTVVTNGSLIGTTGLVLTPTRQHIN